MAALLPIARLEGQTGGGGGGGGVVRSAARGAVARRSWWLTLIACWTGRAAAAVSMVDQIPSSSRPARLGGGHVARAIALRCRGQCTRASLEPFRRRGRRFRRRLPLGRLRRPPIARHLRFPGAGLYVNKRPQPNAAKAVRQLDHDARRSPRASPTARAMIFARSDRAAARPHMNASPAGHYVYGTGADNDALLREPYRRAAQKTPQ